MTEVTEQGVGFYNSRRPNWVCESEFSKTDNFFKSSRLTEGHKISSRYNIHQGHRNDKVSNDNEKTTTSNVSNYPVNPVYRPSKRQGRLSTDYSPLPPTGLQQFLDLVDFGLVNHNQIELTAKINKKNG